MKQYIKLLSGEGDASEKFWKLEECIKKDRKHPGVIMELDKGEMIYDIAILIRKKVITIADLEGFSDELKESVNILLSRRGL